MILYNHVIATKTVMQNFKRIEVIVTSDFENLYGFTITMKRTTQVYKLNLAIAFKYELL